MEPREQFLGERLHVPARDGVGQDELQQLVVGERVALGGVKLLPESPAVSQPVFPVHVVHDALLNTVTDSKWAVPGNMSSIPAVAAR